MKQVKMLALAVLVSALAMFATTGSASATELDNAAGMVTTGSTIAAATEGTLTWHPPIGDVSCTGSQFSGKTGTTGNSAETVRVTLQEWTFQGCNATVTVLKPGSLEIHYQDSNNGTLTSSGAEITTVFLGYHCIYSTSNTDIGTITGSATTGSTATLDISAKIPRTGGTSGAFCGNTAEWTGSYKFTSPDTLNVTAGQPPAAELDNATGMVTTGTSITAAAEGTTTLHPPIGDISCTGSTVAGTTSNTGNSTETIKGTISALTFGGCNATVNVLKPGTLEIHSQGSNNGTLTSSGAEVTVVFLGFHCIFATSNTDIGTVTGSANTGSTATLDISAKIPRTGGTSGAFCGGAAEWTGSYKFTSPDTLNVTVAKPPATELDDATGMVTTGTAITAAAEGTTTLHPPIGDISCTASAVAGSTSNTGSATEAVKGTLSSLTFTGCNSTVTVLKPGSLEIHTQETKSNNNGTLTSSGAEVTVVFLGFHCIFGTSNTDIGTITGSSTTGSTATLDIGAKIPRTGGTSGAFCGGAAEWTGSYKFTSPDTLNVT